MAKILQLETSTTMCSVALSVDGKMLAIQEVNEGYSHAEKIQALVNLVLKETELSIADLDAVAVSKGPGSYTGLRIGVSLAKGICFGANIPLISIDTLQAMSLHPKLESFSRHLKIPLLDARRMEVYTCVVDSQQKIIQPTMAVVVDEHSFEEFRNEKIVFFGPGMDKCRDVLSHLPNAEFCENIWPSARQMSIESERKFSANDFEDVAYFEPFYLKDFVAGKPKKIW